MDDTQVGQGRIEKTVPVLFSYDDFLDVGKDTGEPVTPDYTTPKGEFTGEIAYVTINVSGNDIHYDHAAKEKALMMKLVGGGFSCEEAGRIAYVMASP